MAVSMSSRPSGSAEAAPPSVTLRRSPRFDPYKASTAQRAQQRATPRSLKGSVDPSPFAVVPPVLVPKRKRKTSTTATTTADRARATTKATRRASSSLKENEAKEFRQPSAFTGKAIHLASGKRRLEETEPAGISPIKTRSTRRSAGAVTEELAECAPAPRRLLKKKSQPATAEDEVLPRAIIKSLKAQKQPCSSKDKETADTLESTTVNGRFLRPRHRVAGSVIAQTCKSTAASLYKSIVTTILPNSTSRSRKCRKTDVAVAVSTSQLSTAVVQELAASSSSSAPIAAVNDSSSFGPTPEPLSIGNLSPTSPILHFTNPPAHAPSISTPSTTSTPSSPTSDVPLTTKPNHNPATSYPELPESPRATTHHESSATVHPEGPGPLSPYLNVVAVPSNPLPSYPAPSTYDTVDMGSMPTSDAQTLVRNGTSDASLSTTPNNSFIESTYSSLAFALTPVPHLTPASVTPPSVLTSDTAALDVNTTPAFVPCIPAAPHFGPAPIDTYAPFSAVSSPCNLVSPFSPPFPSSSPSSFSDIISATENVGIAAAIVPDGTLVPDITTQGVGFMALSGASGSLVPNEPIQSAQVVSIQYPPALRSEDVSLEKDMDVSMEPADEVPASESDLGFGFVPQDQVQTIQLPEVSFVVPAPAAPADEFAAPTFWPRHAKLTVEWNMFSKSQRWHEYLAQIHAQLLVVPHPGLRKEGNLKRVLVAPELKPMHEVGYQLNDRSLFVSMSRGRVLEICRRMGAETIRDIVADEAWRFFKRTGVFPTNFARTCMRNPVPLQPQPQRQASQSDPSAVQVLPVSTGDSKGEEDVDEAIVDFMSEEIYDFELEDEDAMEEDEDVLEDARLDPRLPARFRVYFPEEEVDDDDESMEVVDVAVESNDVQGDDETEDDSSYSDDSDDSDDADDMELVASTDMDESAPDGGCGFMQLDLQLPAQEPTSPNSLAPQEDLFHIPIAHQVNFDQSAWEDARHLHGMLQTAQDAQRQGLADPPPPLPINVGMLRIPLNIPSFASIRLRYLSASDSFSCGQLPLRGTKADKVINFAWHLSPPAVAPTDISEHHARTGSVAVLPPRVYRHAIIKPPEVIKSFLKVAFVEVAQLSQTRKRVREQQGPLVEDLERSRPRLRLDNGLADQQASAPSTATCVSPSQGSAMAWMSMADPQPQQGMTASLQTDLQYQSAVLETAYTQVTDMFQQGDVWYYGMSTATSNDFPPVHHAPPPVYPPSTSSSLSNALG